MAVLVADEPIHIRDVVASQSALLPYVGEGESVGVGQGGPDNLDGEVARWVDVAGTLGRKYTCVKRNIKLFGWVQR